MQYEKKKFVARPKIYDYGQPVNGIEPHSKSWELKKAEVYLLENHFFVFS